MAIWSNTNRIHFFLAVLVALLVSLYVFGYNATSSAARRAQCEFHGIERSDGWAIPGLEGAIVTDQQDALTAMSTPEVSIRKMAPNQNHRITHIEWFRCSPDHLGNIQIVSRTVKIDGLWRIESHGKIFAYVVAAQWIEVGKNGRILPVAGFSDIMFQDLKGDGVFTVREDGSLRVPPAVPDWVAGSPSHTSDH